MTAAIKQPPRARGSRRMARELALRALYQWRLAGADFASLLTQAEEADEYKEAHAEFFARLLEGVLTHASALEAALAPHLDRPPESVSPIEYGILMIGAYELLHTPDVPYRVVINEAIELAKRYGGSDGHKYVNGILDALARQARALERQSGAR